MVVVSVMSETGVDGAVDLAARLLVEAVAPTGVVWSGHAVFCVIPGAAGEIGVLPGHAPLATLLREGSVRITAPGGGQLCFEVTGGFAFVTDSQVRVLIDEFEPSQEADRSRR